MRAVIQRVSQAAVRANGRAKAKIGPGLVVSIGVARNDGQGDADRVVSHIINMRIFNDEDGKMSQSLTDVGGEVILQSRVSLLGDCGKGRRPSFTHLASEKRRAKLFTEVESRLTDAGVQVYSTTEENPLELVITSDGPVTLLVDTKRTILAKKRPVPSRPWYHRRRRRRRRYWRNDRRDHYRDRGYERRDRYRDDDYDRRDRYRDRDHDRRDRYRDDQYDDRDRYRDDDRGRRD